MPAERPFLSVVVPVHNRSALLRACLDSLAAQSFRAFEVVIVDDGSDEDLRPVVQAYPSLTLQFLQRPQGGPGAARQTGGLAAQGAVILYLDSDDTLAGSALAGVAAALQDPEAVFGVLGHRRTVLLLDRKGREIARREDSRGCPETASLQDFYDWKIRTTASGLFHRRDVWDRGVVWATDFWIEDLDFLMQWACLAPDGFRYIPGGLVNYTQRFGGESLCAGASYADWARAFGQILARHRADPLMKNPDVFAARIQKYEKLQEAFDKGEAPGPAARQFPALFEAPNVRTLEAYETGADAYVAKSPSRPLPRVIAWLDAAIQGLSSEAALFEIGSGPGREALYLRERGFEVQCSDAAESFVRLLTAQGLAARRVNVLSDALGGPYDLIMANAVFLHLPPADFIRALRRCSGALRPLGRLALTLKEGDGEAWEAGKVGAPRYFNYWRQEPLEAALAQESLTVKWICQTPQPETDEVWISLVAEKTA